MAILHAVYLTVNGQTFYSGAHDRIESAKSVAFDAVRKGYALEWTPEGSRWIPADRAYVVSAEQGAISILESCDLPDSDSRVTFTINKQSKVLQPGLHMLITGDQIQLPFMVIGS